MTEIRTTLDTGIAVIVVNIALLAWLRGDIRKLDDRGHNQGERMARLGGLLEGLREAVTGSRAA